MVMPASPAICESRKARVRPIVLIRRPKKGVGDRDRQKEDHKQSTDFNRSQAEWWRARTQAQLGKGRHLLEQQAGTYKTGSQQSPVPCPFYDSP